MEVPSLPGQMHETQSEKYNKAKMAGDMAGVVEVLLSKLEVLSSKCEYCKKSKK
jgi:hypothetical protein